MLGLGDYSNGYGNCNAQLKVEIFTMTIISIKHLVEDSKIMLFLYNLYNCIYLNVIFTF